MLFSYVTLHLVCHALGLVSLHSAEAGLRATVLLWHSGPGTVLLYGAAALQIGLALLPIYDRRTLRMAPLNAIRIALGLVMPLALIGHFIETRHAFERFGLVPKYSRIAATSGPAARRTDSEAAGARLVHGFLGLRFAYSHSRFWRRWHLALFALALLLPVMAALGFVSMGRELTVQRAVIERQPAAGTAQRAGIEAMRESTLDGTWR